MKPIIRFFASRFVIAVVLIAALSLTLTGLGMWVAYHSELASVSSEVTRKKMTSGVFSNCDYTSLDDFTCEYDGIVEPARGKLDYQEARALARVLFREQKKALDRLESLNRGAGRDLIGAIHSGSVSARNQRFARIDTANMRISDLEDLYDELDEECVDAFTLTNNCEEYGWELPRKERGALGIARGGVVALVVAVGLMIVRRKVIGPKKETTGEAEAKEPTTDSPNEIS